MLPFVIFDFSLLLAICFAAFLLNKYSPKWLLEWATICTISIYRIATAIGLTLGLKFEELGASQWRYDHKWLGITGILAISLLWPREKATNYRLIGLAVCIGAVIDEVSEFLMLLQMPIPLTFRDSIPDLLLIGVTLFGFLGVRFLLRKQNRPQQI